MTNGQSQDARREGAPELIQSRDATLAEALAIFRAQVRAFRRRLAAVPGYRLCLFAYFLLLLGSLVGFAVALHLHWIPRIPSWLLLPVVFLIAYGACRAWNHYYYRVCAGLYQGHYKAGLRFRLNQGGITVTSSGIVSSIPWSAISEIASDLDCLMIHLSPIHSICLPKSAFEHQDVEAFCGELQQRWRAMAADRASAQ
jgi:hypothetical protein